MQDVHNRLRESLQIARAAVDKDNAVSGSLGRELLLFCTGFCAALQGHHRGEDSILFPALVKQHPELAPVVTALQQDHNMLSHLVGELEKALHHRAEREDLHRHLDGIEAIMESHFGYEERQLVQPLARLDLGSLGRPDVLGPLA